MFVYIIPNDAPLDLSCFIITSLEVKCVLINLMYVELSGYVVSDDHDGVCFGIADYRLIRCNSYKS